MKSLSLSIIVCLFAVLSQLSPAQTIWTKYSQNPVLSPGLYVGLSGIGIDGAFDSRSAYSPSVIDDGALLRMWYTGYESYWTGHNSIGYAVSEDGNTWCTYNRNPVLSAGSGFDQSDIWLSVVLKDAGYSMYYSGSDGSRWRVGLATSTDGIHWAKNSANPILSTGSQGSWDDNGVWGVSVLKVEPGSYRMWYSGKSSTDGKTRIGYATSPDGVTWTKYSGNPVLSPVAGWESQGVYVPRVVSSNGTYHMFYLGNPGTTRTQIGYAYSSDGIAWTKYSSNPVLTAGSPGQWDQTGLIDHAVTLKGSTLTIWYGGADSYNTWQIGYATSPLGPVNVKPTQEVPREFRLQQNYPNPFNPSTTIEYDVPAGAHITLKVYNALGQEIATLVDEERTPGSYSAVWDAKELASGTYWSRLTADGKSVVQKMLLVR